MTRLSLGRTAAVGALACALVYAAHAQDKKPAAPAKPADPKPAASTAADPADGSVSPQTQKINELIRKGYESAGIKRPAARATDHEFLRRVFIDIIGRIATAEEVLDFERDRSPDRRVKLVQRLLSDSNYVPRGKNGQPFVRTFTEAGSRTPRKETLSFNYAEEYADHWADIWTVWLMTRTGHQDYREQMHVWLAEQFSKNVSHKDMVVKLLTATGQVGGARSGEGYPYKDSYAANFIVHHLGEPIRDPEDRKREGAFDAVPITSRVTKLFLGLQTQCTQCHDHPFNKEWIQSDFWGVNGFFRQTVRSATPTGAPVGNNQKMANAALVTLTDDASLNPELLVYYERRDGRRLGSFPVMLKDYEQALAGEKSKKMIAGAGSKTRRQQLAEWVVSHDNFGRAYVNRLWSHFFGRGLNKEPSPDDFGSNNDVVHPDLLAYLAEEIAQPQYNYDPKRLIEWICTSDAYQLSHVAVKEYADIKYDAYFARMPLKAMSPEVLFESLMTATKPGKRTKAQQEQRKAARDAWMRKLVRQFGDDEGNELNFNGTIVQALLMMNGTELNGEIGVGRDADVNNVIRELMRQPGGSSATKIYDDLFLMTLNRHATTEEKAKLEQVRTQVTKVDGTKPAPKRPTPKGPNPKGPTPLVSLPGGDNYSFYQDVLWALLNTNEFMINH